MPYKSKRNRRNIPQNRSVSSSQAAPNAASMTQTSASQPVKMEASYKTASKVEAAAAPSYPYILGEIKWIGMVTVIIAAILIVLYVFLH